MTHFSRIIFALCFVFILAASGFAAGDEAPGWLRQAASVQTPTYKKDVPAVVLLDEEKVTLEDGKVVTVENFAVKILTREGRDFATASAFYLASFGKIRDMDAWVIRPDGTVKEYGKKSIVDRISDPDDVYDEYRIKLIDASGDVDTGYIFGYTVVSEDKPLFYQDVWQFQGRLPAMTSRYVLNLPSGWKASSITFNHPNVEPKINGTSYTWELSGLAPIPPEPMSPAIKNLAPHIAINYAPENNAQAANRVFADWKEVSLWASQMYDPQVVINDEVAAKARELTANQATELEKIRAIGHFVQNLQYISIDIGVGYGNGYRPRPSNLVLSRGYGDCKDKATLMRAMLKAIDIEAYPIAIYSGDPTYVRAEWVSPRQFNHCIIAVKVSDKTESPTIINDKNLGRLLIFDATDPFTPVGDLPDYLQGSSALIIAGEKGSLAKMPVTPPEFNAWNRKVEVNLTEDGSISGTISENANGQQSTQARAVFRTLSAAEVNQMFERWLTRGATAARLEKLTSKNDDATATFDLDIKFSAPNYGQLMQNRLLVFKPAIVNRANSIYLTEKERTHPVLIDGETFNETATFNLPAGFVIDEMPDAVSIETAFGKYKTNYEAKDGKLVYTRNLTMNRTTVAAAKYDSVRDFFTKILAAEQSPVVLLRK